MQQILCEQGLLNPTVMYVAKIKADDDAETENKIQYSDVLADCPNFANELTSLQHLADELRSSIDCSTKSHPELAGEGIEYSWGRAKCFYQSAKLKDKTGKANFLKLVQTSLSMTTHEGGGLDIHLIQKFSRCTRQYILAYYYLEHDCGKKEVDELNIEKVRKEFKTHWSAIDFDEQFIKHTHASNVCSTCSTSNEQQEEVSHNT